MENELGTMQKPPKLMSLDEYVGWSGRFKNWVQANHFECWMKIEAKYVPPVNGMGLEKGIGSLTETKQIDFKAEKKMVSILQQAIKEDILVLLQHEDNSQSMWQALKLKFQGSVSMIKSKKALIKKEFDIFTGIKGETTKQLIERYCHLQAIYHRPNQQQTVQRPHIENKPEKALIVNQDDEKVAAGFSWEKYIPGSNGQAMMAEVVEISEMVSEPERVAEDVSVVVEEVSADNAVDMEEIAAGVYYYQSEQKVLGSLMKSVLPPNISESFAGYFEEPRTGSCPRFEEKKEVVEELIDVSKEMTGEVLKDIADKALMGKLKEVDSESEESKSVSNVSVKREESGVQEIKSVKISESESNNVGKTDCVEQIVEKFDLGQVKEAYDTLARSIKMIQKESVENDKATKLAKATLLDKQTEVNFHLDTIASLKKELELVKIENDQSDKKLMSYVASSYVLDQIVPQQPHSSPVLDEESEKSEKTHSEKAVSDSENEGNFLDRYVPKSEKSENEDPIMVVYTMIGTDKIYSDYEYPLQNVKIENVEKKAAKQVFKPKEKINDVFVAGPSVDDEKDYIFSQKAVDDFNAAKKLKEESVKSTFVEYDKRIVKSKPSVEFKKMENALKNDSNLFKDDVVEFENEVDKFLDEFPHITNKVKTIAKEVIQMSHLIFRKQMKSVMLCSEVCRK
ncbi:uncharacterized protein LOC110870613 [Helianthus annuus]|uniref:uncharacterized protein LOC110870613 n=1 Tax=Helianthus annuus TaxID=4232 RepID=UPI000B8FA7D6|nr:uncharacterized protein LOC110870613 [Helianthus annuus]